MTGEQTATESRTHARLRVRARADHARTGVRGAAGARAGFVAGERGRDRRRRAAHCPNSPSSESAERGRAESGGWRKWPRRGRCWGEACINGEAEAGGRAGGEGNESEMGKRARPDLGGAKARTGGPAWQTDKTKVGAISVRQPKALLTASYY